MDRLNDRQRKALVRHGYDPDAAPSGVSGGTPRTWRGYHNVLLRQHVCDLDGIEIDGHEGSDLDPGGGCIHCRREWSEIDDLEDE